MKPIGPAMALAALLFPAAPRAYEEPRHEVVAKGEGFEIRRYAPHLVAETEVAGPFGEARSQAFRRLFRYISGANRDGAEVAMTVPVTTAPSGGGAKIAMTVPVTSAPGEAGGYVMRFAVPSRYTLETVPQPTDPAVRIREVGEQWVAAARYSGRASEANYREQEATLLARLAAAGRATAGKPWFAVYDGPWTLWFLRRNEVLVAVEPPAPGEAGPRTPAAAP